MKRTTCLLTSAAVVVGLTASACGGSSESTATKTETVTETTASASATSTSAGAPATTTPAPAMTGSADLPSLIPTPADTQRTDGPDTVHDGGTHKHFLVSGAPTDVMNAYKGALESGGWAVTVENAGGGGGGGGATYTGANGGAYGVFVGGGYGSSTDVDACVWPSKPAHTNCGHDN